jgi:hypothetical protein
VAGVGDQQPMQYGVVHGVEAGRHVLTAQPLRLLVEVVQDLVGRKVEPGQGLHDGAQLAHHGGRRHGVAHDVADHQRDTVAGQGDRVVPVAAHLRGARGGQVTACQLDSGGLGQCRREHRVLQCGGYRCLAEVERGLVDAECRVGGELGGDEQVVFGEGGPVGAADEDDAAHDVAAAVQRGTVRGA